MPYQRAKVVHVADDGTWTDLPAGSVGTLAIGGPTVFAGYVTGRSSDGLVTDGLGKVVDGWLDTGDVANIDAEGIIRLTGRAKDLIIRGGHNIDPVTIEDALLSHPEVLGAGAVGRPDVHAGEVPVAFVTVTPGSTATPAELVAWATARVQEAAAAPREVAVIDALPMTDVGKPNKLPLRARAARTALASDLADLVTTDAVDAVVEDGSVCVVVDVGPSAARDEVERRLSRYAIAWRWADRVGDPV